VFLSLASLCPVLIPLRKWPEVPVSVTRLTQHVHTYTSHPLLTSWGLNQGKLRNNKRTFCSLQGLQPIELALTGSGMLLPGYLETRFPYSVRSSSRKYDHLMFLLPDLVPQTRPPSKDSPPSDCFPPTSAWANMDTVNTNTHCSMPLSSGSLGYRQFLRFKKLTIGQVLLTHTSNYSYSGNKDQENQRLKLFQANSHKTRSRKHKKKLKRWLKWQSTCLASVKPWFQITVPPINK
jgi:hypothetical protein